jgi:subtilisin family serine protease
VLRDSFYGSVPLAETASGFFSCSADERDHGSTWALNRVNAPAAWAKSLTGNDVSIAVIDTGWSKHPEVFEPSVYDLSRQKNLIERGQPAEDQFSNGNPGHGTLVASVVASRGGITASHDATTAPGSVTGIAPQAQLVPIRTIKSVINIRMSRVAKAIDAAIAADCDVIVMALGGPTPVRSVRRALKRAVEAGLVVCCAAGNCWPPVVYPASYAKRGLCVAVGAVGPQDRVWPYSSQGGGVTLAAPGWNVWGARMDGPDPDQDASNKPSQGTTLAVSITSGAAALWLEHHGGPEAVRQAAQTAGATVQSLFMNAVTEGLERPKTWPTHARLGKGVLDISKLLAASLKPHIGFDDGEGEGLLSAASLATLSMDDNDLYRDEAIWRSFQRAARVRAAASKAAGVPGAEDIPPMPEPSPSYATISAETDLP